MGTTLPGAILTRLSDLLAARIGLHFPEKCWDDLERGVAAAAPALGASDTLSCAHRLLSTPLTRRELAILASRLTIGETYFFREKHSLETFERHILPDLLNKRRSGDRRLRIWSAGCCTGEEPYSVAMLFDRVIPEVTTWNITLLATDINPDFLTTAAQAEYGEWSFRDVPDSIRQRYFKYNHSGRFQLDEQIRNRVLFSCLNLADDIYPSLISNTNAMDVIFCRNVLMYFTPEQAKTVVDRLYRSLVDGGWLIVSPAETSSVLFSHFTAVVFNGVTLYRKCENTALSRHANPVPDPAMAAYLKPLSPADQSLPPSRPTPPEKPAIRLRGVTTGSGSTQAAAANREESGQAARDLANQGRLDEAAERCHAVISSDRLNPGYHYLLATIQQEQGRVEAAAQSFARALYLDSDFVLAYFALGNLYRSQGRQREAQKQFDDALRLLRRHPADEILPESEGMTAGRLGEIIESIGSNSPGAGQ